MPTGSSSNDIGRDAGRPGRGSITTVPWKRRWLLARRPELASGVHTVALRTIERWYAAAGGAPKTGRTGSVTATQRFGKAATQPQ